MFNKTIYAILIFFAFSMSFIEADNKKLVLTKKSKLLKNPRATSSWHKVKLNIGDKINVRYSDNKKYYAVSYLGKDGWINKRRAKLVTSSKQPWENKHSSTKTYKRIQNLVNVKKDFQQKTATILDKINWNIVLTVFSVIFGWIISYLILKKIFLGIKDMIINGISKISGVVKDPIPKDHVKVYRTKKEKKNYDFRNNTQSLFENFFLAFKLFVEGLVNIINTFINNPKNRIDLKRPLNKLNSTSFPDIKLSNTTKGVIALAVAYIVIINWNDSPSPEYYYNNTPTVDVRGYYKKDGTFVKPHKRTKADGNPYNNFSYPGNYNPNTGRVTTGSKEDYLNNYYGRNKNSYNNYNSTTKTGDTYFHSNGESTTKIGDTYFHSNGESSTKIGDTYFHSNGESSSKIGDTYFHSNGETSTNIGNTIFNSDGSSSTIIGNDIFHND